MIAGASWIWWVGFHAAVLALLLVDSLLPGHRRETRHPQLVAWLGTAGFVEALSAVTTGAVVSFREQSSVEVRDSAGPFIPIRS